MVIKAFHYSNLAFAKSNLIAKKIIQLYLDLYHVTKLEFFCNTKDMNFVVYEFICPGCIANYVGKTERTLHERCAEYAWDDKDSIVFNHLNDCISVRHTF